MNVLILFSISVLFDGIGSLAVPDSVEDRDNNININLAEDWNVLDEKAVYKRPIPSGPTYFCEPFDTRAEFLKRWVHSQAMKDDMEKHLAKYDGKWIVDEPSNNPIVNDLGLILKSKAKHHAISAKLDKPFMFNGKPLIVQYEVKFQNGMDCGGAYIKLLSQTGQLNLKNFTDKTPYTIMFGPDKCGNDHKLHFIVRHKNLTTGEFEEKHAEKPTVKLEDYFIDRKTHLYTLIVNSNNNSYEMKVDNQVVATGSLFSNISTQPEEIDDPSDIKPEEWDDRAKIIDPTVQKPEDWDESEPDTILDESAVMPVGWLEEEEPLIPDPDTMKPDDWETIRDDEWEAPLIENPKCRTAPGCGKWERPSIPNPRYKGKWMPPMIDNPDFKGEWRPKQIPNPRFSEEVSPFEIVPVEALGLELWSMTENIIFDNFIIADNATVVEEFTSITWELKNIQEKSESSTGGWWEAITNSAAEHPWLWVVYSVVPVLIIILLFLCFCPSSGSKKQKTVEAHKKFDQSTPNVYDAIKEEEEDVVLKDKKEERKAGEGVGIRRHVAAICPSPSPGKMPPYSELHELKPQRVGK